MNQAPRNIYLLRKSKQVPEIVPVLDKNDFPLRFHFKGREIQVAVTQKGKLQLSEVTE